MSLASMEATRYGIAVSIVNLSLTFSQIPFPLTLVD